MDRDKPQASQKTDSVTPDLPEQAGNQHADQVSPARSVTNPPDRRQFLIRVAQVALSAGAVAVLVDACTSRQKVLETTAPSPPVTTTGPPTPSLPPLPEATAGPPVPAPPTKLMNVIETERGKVGHLLRRAGFGANQDELGRFTEMGAAATVDYLLNFENTDDSAMETRLAGVNLNLDNLVDQQRWWLLRMIYTRRPLQEKMVLFWHGLLTSGYGKVGRGPYMMQQNEMLRKLCVANYADMLKAIARDPAMLIWLDSQVNRKGAPNENFARELMELFTTGPGHYSETDVRESARAFTGWLLVQKVFSFNQNAHDYGVKTFLGKTGNFDGNDIIDIIMAQPATAEFISRKLFAFFVYDDPAPETISRLAATFRDSGHSIKELMRQMLTSPEFYSPQAYRAKVKSPTEFIAATIRTLDIKTDAFGLPGYSQRMGQDLLNPFDVSGWRGGAEWLNSNTILQRLNFANTVATARASGFQFNPAETTARFKLATGDKVVAYLADLLLDGNLSDDERAILVAFAGVPDVPGAFTNGGSPVVDEKLRSLVYLLLASPDYQLA